MAELIGRLIGSLPVWLVVPVMLVIVVVAVEVTLAQTGDSLTDIWKDRYGKK